MNKVPSVNELQKICFRTNPDIYRKVSIYFTRLALLFGVRANTITILRTILLFLGVLIFSFAPISILWIIAGILAFQLVLFLDTMDGAIARYNKEASFFGEALDFILDHLSSSIIYFITAGILCYRLFGSSNLLWTAIVTAVLAQLAVFLRALYAEYDIDIENLRRAQCLFSFFHQDNMRLLLLALTVGTILHFFNTQSLPFLVVAYLQFMLIKILFLGGFLWVLAGKFPITTHLVSACFFSLLWIIFRTKKLRARLMNYKKTKVVQIVLNLAVHKT